MYEARTSERANELSLSGEAEKIGESVVPIVQPVGRSMTRLALFARVDLLLRRHVLFAAYAEVALDGTAAHRTAVELAEARGANAGMPARQQGARQGKILAHHAQLLARAVPQGGAVRVARVLTGCYKGAAAAGSSTGTAVVVVVVAGFGECQCRSQTRRHVALIVVARVARGQVQLLRRRRIASAPVVRFELILDTQNEYSRQFLASGCFTSYSRVVHASCNRSLANVECLRINVDIRI